MPANGKRRPGGGGAHGFHGEADTPKGTPRPKLAPASAPVVSAWTTNITMAGRDLPERWRVGGPDRANLLRSIEALIAKDVTTVAADLIANGVEPMDAAVRAGALWQELADDGACRGITLVLIAAGGAT